MFNNGALGFIELEQKSSGFLNAGTELEDPNFAVMAEAVGIRGIRLKTPPMSKAASPRPSLMMARF